LEKEISYARIPLIPALEKTAAVSREPVRELFHQSALALKYDRAVTAREAWNAGLSSFQKRGILIEEDLAIVRLIGERLGTSDVVDQIKMLRLVIEELKIQEEKSRLRETAEKKIWTYGGFLAGLMICILII
jgi:stage III sporulation protein AB